MRKRILFLACGLSALLVSVAGCGGSHCKKYAEKFCADDKSPACLQAKEKIKNWSSDKCRMELNELLLEEQSKNLENELK